MPPRLKRFRGSSSPRPAAVLAARHARSPPAELPAAARAASTSSIQSVAPEDQAIASARLAAARRRVVDDSDDEEAMLIPASIALVNAARAAHIPPQPALVHVNGICHGLAESAPSTA